MRSEITTKLLKEATPKAKPYEIRDSELRGFLLRVQPSGVRTYYVEYARHKRVKVCDAAVLSPALAREEARKILADYVRGTDPGEERKKARAHTLKTYVEERYAPWAKANMRHSGEPLRRIALFYTAIGDRKLAEIDAWSIEKWRSARLKTGVKPITVNHDMAALRAALARAIEWGLLTLHPMARIKQARVDAIGRIRYLSSDEEQRLRAALDAREAKRRSDRDSANEWRRERGYQAFPEHGAFTDHLKPLVLVALNTGLRRGELFALRRQDVDLERRMLTVAGATAKNGKTRHVPLNDQANAALKAWLADTEGEHVFGGRDGSALTSAKSAWLRLMKDAEIPGFRFHDLRHDFASKLVMAGVDLNTVRELLGHADIKMTLRYAHLAPERTAAAVAKLVRPEARKTEATEAAR